MRHPKKEDRRQIETRSDGGQTAQLKQPIVNASAIDRSSGCDRLAGVLG